MADDWENDAPEAFEDAVEVDTAGPGDNVTDETIQLYARKIILINEEAKKVAARRQTIRKEAKASGVTLGTLDAMIKLLDMSPGEQREHFAERHRYAAALRMPIGAQLDLMAHATDTEVQQTDAYARGFGAATTGKGVPGVPPDELSPMYHQDWMRGWSDGQVANAPGQLEDAG